MIQQENLIRKLYDRAIEQGLSPFQASCVVKAAKKEFTVLQETTGIPINGDRAVNNVAVTLLLLFADGEVELVSMPNPLDNNTWTWQAKTLMEC